MTANYLQMIDSKSEILPVIPRHKTDMTQGLRVRVGSDYVTAVHHVINLGVYLDRHLDMTTQVSRTISTCSLHMRNTDYSLSDAANNGAGRKCPHHLQVGLL